MPLHKLRVPGSQVANEPNKPAAPVTGSLLWGATPSSALTTQAALANLDTNKDKAIYQAFGPLEKYFNVLGCTSREFVIERIRGKTICILPNHTPFLQFT